MQLRWMVPWLLCAAAGGADWPQWGGGDTRRMVSAEINLPADFAPGEKNALNTGLDLATTRNVKWAVKLGTQTCGTPVIAEGKVFIGTNNGSPRDPRLTGDRSVLMCFDEATGRFLWQLATSKLRYAANFNGDCPGLGDCSTPTVKDHRVYLATMRCEAVCLDADGLANGNDGPFRDEGAYIAQATILKRGAPPAGGYPDQYLPAPAPAPLPLQPTDADIVWRYDFEQELGVWPQDATDCSPLVDGDYVYVGTSNGVDKGHKKLPNPLAPTLIILDRRTGRLVAADDAQIGTRTLHGNWSSPSLAVVNGRKLVLFGGGDGYCYAFDAEPVPAPGGTNRVLRTVWRCDCNPPEYRERDGRKLPYNANSEGPSEVIATPAFDHNRVYVTIGQDTRHGPGPGALTCMDATRTGDISRTGVLWRYTAINRSFSTPAVADGLVFVADVRGVIHCLDAASGACYWTHATLGGNSMSSTLVADGRVYYGNANGKLTILAAAREKKLLNEIRVGSALHATPVAANGVLYVATQHWLYALQLPKG